jgi:hypothetical protein
MLAEKGGQEGEEGWQRRGRKRARVFERIRGGSEDKEERKQVVVGVAMGKKVEHAPLVLSPRKRTKKEGCFGLIRYTVKWFGWKELG